MAEYCAEVEWYRGNQEFIDNRYSRRHLWRFDGGVEIPASSSFHIVPEPYSDPLAVDPEEAFVAALSSCHMLVFLGIAAKRGYVVDSYADSAVGIMENDADGKLAITRVTLRPNVQFSGENSPNESEIEKLHHQAHKGCFIASSVKSDVLCEPIY